MRTAAAGAVAAKYLAPKHIDRIGIVGTGAQARFQLGRLKSVTDCRDACVWGRDERKGEQYKSDMIGSAFSVQAVSRIEELMDSCNLIVTTTAAREPLLYASQLLAGTHVTAVGADAQRKQELDQQIFHVADAPVGDTITHWVDHGATYRTVNKGSVEKRQ